MKYVALSKSRYSKYDLKILSKFDLFRTLEAFNDLPFSLRIHTHLEPITFWIETLVALKKSLEILIEKSLDL